MNILDYKQRREKILSLKRQGLSLTEIGKTFNLSRQRIEQIIIKEPRSNQNKNCTICKKKLRLGIDGIKYCLPCRIDFGWRLEGREFTRGAVRRRDKETCRKCKKVWKSGRKFDVHHLNGLCGKNSNAYDSIKNLKGLITLCHKCHLSSHGVRTKMRNCNRIDKDEMLSLFTSGVSRSDIAKKFKVSRTAVTLALLKLKLKK